MNEEPLGTGPGGGVDNGCAKWTVMGCAVIVLLCSGCGLWGAWVDSRDSIDTLQIKEGMSGDEVIKIAGKPIDYNRMSPDEVEWNYAHFYVNMVKGKVAHVQLLKW